MAGKTSKWLTGCGIGCGVVAILLGALAVGGYFLAKKTFRGLELAQKSYTELEARLGQVAAYGPAPDGAIDGSRLRLFLAVRDSLGPSRRQVEGLFRIVPSEDARRERVNVTKVLKVLRELSRYVEPVGGYIDARNRLLMSTGMSMGEYLYIYCLSYYTYLGHDPSDGPVVTGGEGDRPGRPGEPLFDDQDSSFGAAALRRSYRRITSAFVRNQLEAARQQESADRSWRDLLAAEAARFENSPGHILWRGDPPPAVAASLAPFRERLESSYSATLNCFELPPHEHGG
jgi:hypothetical protein